MRQEVSGETYPPPPVVINGHCPKRRQLRFELREQKMAVRNSARCRISNPPSASKQNAIVREAPPVVQKVASVREDMLSTKSTRSFLFCRHRTGDDDMRQDGERGCTN